MQAYSPFDTSSEATIISTVKTSEIVVAYKKIYDLDISSSFRDIETIYLCECPLTSLRFYYPFNLDGDAAFYEKLSLKDWYYSVDRWEHLAVAGWIESGKSLLEIGPGDGVFLQKLKALKNISYVGLELNPLAIEKAKLRGIHLTNELLEHHVANKANSYDVVCSFQVMEHISAIHSAMTDSVKALKKGGLLIIAVPNNGALFKSNIHPSKYLNMPPHHVNLFDEKSLLGISRLYDLKLRKIMTEPLQDNHIDVVIYNTLGKFVFKNEFLMKLIWKTGIQVLFRPLVKKFRKRIKGHTIIGIFEK
ncbi:hypothetical protein CNR22_12560 [Sphingobacteriaceae bacterium]|nr:hypothetical protein CNR22_12560 [Sphingobacteriaceae bacterium]